MLFVVHLKICRKSLVNLKLVLIGHIHIYAVSTGVYFGKVQGLFLNTARCIFGSINFNGIA